MNPSLRGGGRRGRGDLDHTATMLEISFTLKAAPIPGP
jgi:hypothetical protein